MNVFAALVRKHWVESKWVLGVSVVSFFGLAILTTWLTRRFERLAESAAEVGRAARGARLMATLGGPEMDFSSTALMVCWWNHPVIVLTVLSWAIHRGSASIAGEIERGTVDLTLSRPVTRSAYLTSQVVYFLLGMVALAAALVAGDLVGSLIYPLKSAPGVATLVKPAVMVVALGMAVFGYTLPFSAIDVVRWRATLAATGLTLAGLIAMSLARTPDFEKYEWIDRLSVFRAYAPVTVAIKGEPLAYNASVLGLVFAAGLLVAYPLFAYRDIPSNS